MNVQDQLLAMFPAGGTFVEAGAHDGVGDSQTIRLEQAGWTGLCVEPSSAFAGLKASRKCRVDGRALFVSDGLEVTFREVDGEAIELSGILSRFEDDGWDRETRAHRDRKVHTVSLSTMLREHGMPPVIEFLCLDTEGSELSILSPMPLPGRKFLTILVEHNGRSRRREQLLDLLLPLGYAARWDDGINLFFVHGDVKRTGWSCWSSPAARTTPGEM